MFRMYRVLLLSVIPCWYCYKIIKETILDANFTSNGQWPDENISGNKFPFLQGYWDISNIPLDQVRFPKIILQSN